jgi:short subunit dehydrogenase-like uncharacterized protein
MTNASARKFDVVVFGATSFVGQILCKHLVARHGTTGKAVHWAIAGRSATKLAEVAKSTGQGQIRCDVHGDQDAREIHEGCSKRWDGGLDDECGRGGP